MQPILYTHEIIFHHVEPSKSLLPHSLFLTSNNQRRLDHPTPQHAIAEPQEERKQIQVHSWQAIELPA